MRRLGHIGINLLLGTPLSLLVIAFNMDLIPVFILVMLVTATLPDIDFRLSRSIIGRILGIKHRGFTHTVYFAILVGLLCAMTANFYDSTVVGLLLMFASGFLGITFHIIGDILTPTGINYAPYIQGSSYSLDWFNYNNTIANIGFFVTGVMSAFFLSRYINDGQPEMLILWIALYVLFVPIIILSAKRIEVQYKIPFVGRLLTLRWWMRRIK